MRSDESQSVRAGVELRVQVPPLPPKRPQICPLFHPMPVSESIDFTRPRDRGRQAGSPGLLGRAGTGEG